MSRVRSANTTPEMTVRRLVHSMGYRYRLHAKDLPGKPDIVFRKHKKAIFVHGCFWHQHGCDIYRNPRTNREFWETKLAKNVQRDNNVRKELESAGWQILTIWECETENQRFLKMKIENFLEEK